MSSPLETLFRSEIADRVIRFLQTRGNRARIIAPAWVQERVLGAGLQNDAASGASWSDEPLGAVPKTDGIWNFIVIAKDVPQERADLDHLALRKGMKAYGLFTDLLPALLCSVNGFARGRSIRNTKRYAVLCVPRSGSRYLAAMLNRSGLGAPQEHLREPLAEVITDGKLGFPAAFEALERFGQRNGIFGTKLISTFLIKSSRGNLVELESNIGWMASRGYEFVHLDRALNDTVVSSYIAFRLNKWHFFQHLDTPTRSLLDELVFDDRAAWDEYIRFRAQDAVIDHIAKKFNVPSFSYSDVQRGVDGIIASISDRLNVDPEGLDAGSAPIPVATRTESATYEAFAKNLDEVLARRRREIVPHTIKALRNLVGVDQATAERLSDVTVGRSSAR